MTTEVKYDVRFKGQSDGCALASGVAAPADAGFSEVMIVAHSSEGGAAGAGVKSPAGTGELRVSRARSTLL